MKKKHVIVTIVVIAVLAALIYLQVRQWRNFDWGKFRHATANLDVAKLLIALVLIYADYVLRAFRWRVLTKCVADVPSRRLIGPQFIGFAGLGLFGRPGEFIRPYLIARKENVSFASQMAVWTMERIFDIGGFTVLMSIDLFGFADRLVIIREGHHEWLWRLYAAGGFLIAIVIGLLAGALVVRYYGEAVASWIEHHVSRYSKSVANSVCSKILSFREGLHTIHSAKAMAQVMLLSIAIWALIALAYREIIHAYPEQIAGRVTHLARLDLPDVLLLMAASMAGSMLQLPAVGGGSQLATISMMNNWFNIPQEIAVSCGIMLWLITFMAVIPAGLVFARFEHVSLRKMAEESEQQEPHESTGIGVTRP